MSWKCTLVLRVWMEEEIMAFWAQRADKSDSGVPHGGHPAEGQFHLNGRPVVLRRQCSVTFTQHTSPSFCGLPEPTLCSWLDPIKGIG